MVLKCKMQPLKAGAALLGLLFESKTKTKHYLKKDTVDFCTIHGMISGKYIAGSDRSPSALGKLRRYGNSSCGIPVTNKLPQNKSTNY